MTCANFLKKYHYQIRIIEFHISTDYQSHSCFYSLPKKIFYCARVQYCVILHRNSKRNITKPINKIA